MASISEAARQSGVSIETIRYYERVGIVSPADRSASGRRIFDRAGIARLRFVKRCRDLGFPLTDVRTILDLSENTATPCEGVKNISQRHLADIRAKKADLELLETAMTELVGQCNARERECPALLRLFADG